MEMQNYGFFQDSGYPRYAVTLTVYLHVFTSVTTLCCNKAIEFV